MTRHTCVQSFHAHHAITGRTQPRQGDRARGVQAQHGAQRVGQFFVRVVVGIVIVHAKRVAACL